MQPILYSLFLCYLLPLIAMLVSVVTSQLFQTDASLITTTAAISTTFLDSIRTGIGTLLIPLITAYSVQIRHRNENIPVQTKWLIRFLILVFILSFTLHGVIVAHQERLVEYSPQAFDVFKSTSLLYTKELLSYISVVIGISAKTMGKTGGRKSRPESNYKDKRPSDKPLSKLAHSETRAAFGESHNDQGESDSHTDHRDATCTPTSSTNGRTIHNGRSNSGQSQCHISGKFRNG